ncbi:short-chain dehydrogenase/reductase family 16C member 6 [Linepithema humile]|uniref:short-chain dehydrogenase/reductase family 16C member 6 n=1 Tax=Linepithema humile TaxID=83485 RepID=UPI0006237DE1|nr:PREDICTED: short-chain dehydrogenase/reductase family 16C member 6-like [Linepithema humile]
MVKAYNGALILADVLVLILKILYYICESIYKFFVPAEEKSVAGEIVLITGTGHGIGKELALRYASLGATVVCWDLNQQANEETINEIKKTGTTAAYAYQCDVSKREDVLSVAEKVKREVGDVTILVNNAGIMPCHTLLDHTTDEIKRIFDINVLAHFWMLQAFLPSMIEKNHGHVVALSSLAGIGGFPNLVPYCASKFAVRGLMEALSEELRIGTKGKSLIKFTTIYPYMVDTGLCKKPKIKFEKILPLVSTQQAVSQIIRAQRTNQQEKTVPSFWLSTLTITRIFPDNVLRAVADFCDSGVEAVSS